MTTQPQSLSGQPSQAPGLTLLDRRRIQRAAELVAGDHGRAAVAAFLGLADDEDVYEKAFTVACNYLDQLVALAQRLTGSQDTAHSYRDALAAVRESLDIPHAGTVGDEETRNKILLERVGHTVVMLQSILDGEHPAPDVPWSVAYLRARLAEHPAAGYKTWDERVAELGAARDSGR